MKIERYILDANVFLEYIFNRDHSKLAKKILNDAIRENIQVLAPSLMLDEITEVLCGNLGNIGSIKQHLSYFEQLAGEGVLFIVVPNTATRMKAIEIARTGHIKSGYPEISDALYHALAIMNDGVFITNDNRYFSKVRNLGHIKKLSQYHGSADR